MFLGTFFSCITDLLNKRYQFINQLNDNIMFLIDFVAEEKESGCTMSFWSFGYKGGFKEK